MEEKKFCKFCGEQIKKNSIVCPKCGRQLELLEEKNNDSNKSTNKMDENIEKQDQQKFYQKEWFMWTMLIICAPIGILLMYKFNKKFSTKKKMILTIIFGILFLVFTFVPDNTEKIDDNDQNLESEYNKETNKKSYTFNETFEFDDLEITIGDNYKITKVDNQFSEHHKKEVIKLPITIKNIKEKSHSLNMFYYDIFTPNGVESENVWTYFDESVETAGELRPSASYTKYIYFLYDGDGNYVIEFDGIWEEKTVEISIKK